ncbi:MAG: hypothetical protein AAF515_21330 [Pseudomonadota bacterium]
MHQQADDQGRRIRRSIRIRLATVIGCAMVLLGCGSLPPVEEWTWTLDGSNDPNSPEWYSGKSDHTGHIQWTCPTALGTDVGLLAGLRGYPKDRGSDRFMARLDVTCRQYTHFAPSFTQVPPPNGQERTVSMTSSTNFITEDSEGHMLAIDQVPIGLIVYHDGKKHVKNLQIIWGTEENGVIEGYVNWNAGTSNTWQITPPTITRYPGVEFRLATGGPFSYNPLNNRKDLLCPSQRVLAGLAVRQNDKGKIRRVYLRCRLLTNNQP